MRHICIYMPARLSMAKPPEDTKVRALRQSGALNPHAGAVSDPLFHANPFFDPRDLVQVRYEMVRRHKVDGLPVSSAAVAFGVTRPTFYKAQSALEADGLAGLLPNARGPRDGHKLSAEVVAFVEEMRDADLKATTRQCLEAIERRFGVKAHRRSLERALSRKKKRIEQD
jgi:transposase